MTCPVEMGKVDTCGKDICARNPFVKCNMVDFIGDDGWLTDIASFFSMAGYISSP
jgi:hypothetical protein